MNSILITGSNRGLGLGMVRHLLQGKKNASHVFATCRNPDEAKELQELAKNHSNLHILKLDLSNIESFDSLVQEVSTKTNDKGLNLLINNGGVTSKFTTINYVKPQQLMENYLINTVAPIMLTKSFLPLLKQASVTQSTLPVCINRAAVVNISSILASISGNDKGGFYPYRCSKAALNAATRSMSVDLGKDNILVVSIHPGWVKTRMGGNGAPLDVETSVSRLFQTLEKFNKADSGNFYQYDGEKLSW